MVPTQKGIVALKRSLVRVSSTVLRLVILFLPYFSQYSTEFWTLRNFSIPIRIILVQNIIQISFEKDVAGICAKVNGRSCTEKELSKSVVSSGNLGLIVAAVRLRVFSALSHMNKISNTNMNHF